jgi:hypothetical protein
MSDDRTAIQKRMTRRFVLGPRGYEGQDVSCKAISGRAPKPATIECRQPVITAGERLAVEKTGPHPERVLRGGDQRIPLRPVIATAG